jgi:SAM-dependent methyltransferase
VRQQQPHERPPTPHDLRRLRRAARQFAHALQTNRCPSDRAFDRFLADPLRVLSPQYWSPLAVARRAAEWFDAARVRTVVDIGSGAGKFCVAGALFGRCDFVGLEERRFLVESARSLARLFDLTDRVQFVHGSLGDVPAPAAEAYYFYNPFGDYSFEVGPIAKRRPADVEERQARDVAAAEDLLHAAPAGTWVLTLNGFGGRLPKDYTLIRTDWELPGSLRLWRRA